MDNEENAKWFTGEFKGKGQDKHNKERKAKTNLFSHARSEADRRTTTANTSATVSTWAAKAKQVPAAIATKDCANA